MGQELETGHRKDCTTGVCAAGSVCVTAQQLHHMCFRHTHVCRCHGWLQAVGTILMVPATHPASTPGMAAHYSPLLPP